jgi:malonate transporter
MLQVLQICLPVFAVIGFGVVLRRVGFIDDAAHRFLTRFVFLFALPVIIFLGIARSDFGALLQPSIVIVTLGLTALLTAAAWLLTARLPARLRGPVVLSPWFANLAYLGFPLARNAYGDAGLSYAAIINAFTMPVFVALGMSLLAIGHAQGRSRMKALRGAVFNPVIGAVVLGLIVSAAAQKLGLRDAVAGSALPAGAMGIVVAALQMLGNMALPLALIAVGASLRFEYVRGRIRLMLACTAAKLVVTPLLTLVACRLLFPGMPAAALGTTVLLMACPLSVACYVMSRELDTDSDFIAGLLVMTTAGACLTIPAWLWVLLNWL